MTDRNEKGQFQVGHTGLGGRPEGSRNKLAEMFWRDLHDAWREQGKKAIADMIADKPGDFVKVVASQMPKEFVVKSANLEEVSDEELGDFISALRSFVSANAVAAAGDGGGQAGGGSAAQGRPETLQ